MKTVWNSTKLLNTIFYQGLAFRLLSCQLLVWSDSVSYSGHWLFCIYICHASFSKLKWSQTSIVRITWNMKLLVFIYCLKCYEVQCKLTLFFFVGNLWIRWWLVTYQAWYWFYFCAQFHLWWWYFLLWRVLFLVVKGRRVHVVKSCTSQFGTCFLLMYLLVLLSVSSQFFLA